jgi:hypothetical protein
MVDYPNTPGQERTPRSPAELIVVTRADAGIQATPQGVSSTAGAQVADLQNVLSSSGAQLEPLFEIDATTPATASPQVAQDIQEMSRFFHVVAAESQLESIAERLRGVPVVEAAYVKPPAEPARVTLEPPTIAVEPVPAPVEAAPAVTPNFTARQHYLEPAPVGIDAFYAWTLAGGRGANVRVIDCEWGWQLTHEDLVVNNLGIVAGANNASRDHGTAVFGEIGGDLNGFGVTGIASDARLGASSFTNQTSSAAIKAAADYLAAGDIILLEIHRGGPNATGAGQKGYIAVEWWPDDFLAIRYAVNKGIVVVEAAGNGWENLDAAVYNVAPAGFPAWWKNPFNLANPSSGAVLVGAGDPPSPTHGRTISPWNQPYVDRARSGFSNWGTRIDAQGWGWEVTSTGYGDLQNPGDPNRLYTDTFSGTSSASPIVVGAIACTQGVLKAKGMPLLTSERARQLLRATGSPQQAAVDRPATQRIGNRPNLRQLIPAALQQWVSAVVIRFTYAVYSSQSAWAYIDGIGWRQIKSGSPDGVSNVFRVCVEAQAAGTKVNAYIDDTYLYYVLAL